MYSSAPRKSTFVIELTETQLRLVGQLIHLRLFDDPEDKYAKEALDALVEQTNCVSRDPSRMHAYNSSLDVPDGVDSKATGSRHYKKV